MKDINKIKEDLLAGNQTFLEKQKKKHSNSPPKPYAIILTCSDSRVIPEKIFQAGLGDLFVIRVCGHVVSPEVVASVEYALKHFETRALVVLGHKDCGAIKACKERKNLTSPALETLVSRIRPVFDKELSLEEIEKKNVFKSIDDLKAGSSFIKESLDSGDLSIEPAYYNTETGKVIFL